MGAPFPHEDQYYPVTGFSRSDYGLHCVPDGDTAGNSADSHAFASPNCYAQPDT